jgi:hypothetical protein
MSSSRDFAVAPPPVASRTSCPASRPHCRFRSLTLGVRSQAVHGDAGVDAMGIDGELQTVPLPTPQPLSISLFARPFNYRFLSHCAHRVGVHDGAHRVCIHDGADVHANAASPLPPCDCAGVRTGDRGAAPAAIRRGDAPPPQRCACPRCTASCSRHLGLFSISQLVCCSVLPSFASVISYFCSLSSPFIAASLRGDEDMPRALSTRQQPQPSVAPTQVWSVWYLMYIRSRSMCAVIFIINHPQPSIAHPSSSIMITIQASLHCTCVSLLYI